MSYVFNQTERQQIIQAIGQSSGLRPVDWASDGSIARVEAVAQASTNVAPLYTLLSNILASKLVTPELFNQETIKNIQNIKLWMDVAIGANSGVGSQAAFIRTYTNEQAKLRLGRDLTADEMQHASNAVATNLVNFLLNGANRDSPEFLPLKDILGAVLD